MNNSALIELTEKDFKSTMDSEMIDITEIAEPIVDIWPYIEVLVKNNLITEYIYQNGLIDSVYQNEQNTFHHVLIPTDNDNVFIVLVIDIRKEIIKGHIKLNLNKEYGIH